MLKADVDAAFAPRVFREGDKGPGGFAGTAKLNATPVDVPGLGDAAYWVNMGSSTRPSIQLNVFKGKRLWLVFSASAAGLQTDKALADLTKVARSTLDRL